MILPDRLHFPGGLSGPESITNSCPHSIQNTRCQNADSSDIQIFFFPAVCLFHFVPKEGGRPVEHSTTVVAWSFKSGYGEDRSCDTSELLRLYRFLFLNVLGYAMHYVPSPAPSFSFRHLADIIVKSPWYMKKDLLLLPSRLTRTGVHRLPPPAQAQPQGPRLPVCPTPT